VQDYEDDFNSFSIYPNPANDEVTIEILNTIWYNSSVNLYNVIGEIVYQTSVNDKHTVIDISSFTKGVYFIEVENNGIKKFKKLMVQ
jgi:hypothetical protein